MRQNGYSEHIAHSQDELALEHLGRTKAMCYRIKDRLPSFIDVNDLISIATEELIKLARRYDTSINDTFWNYAKTRINGAILDHLRALDVVSRANRKLIKAIDYEVRKFYNEHQIEPSDDELSEILKEDVKKIKDARVASEINLLTPLNDQLDAFETDIAHKIEQEELVDKIKAVLFSLDDRDAMIVQMYFFDELTLAEIREVMGITESRISQIIKQCLRTIRAEITKGQGNA